MPPGIWDRLYLARRTGDFVAAGKFYKASLEIREKLLAKDAAKAMYQHNVAVSHDNLGDLHVARAVALRAGNKDSKVEFIEALGEYRKGLDLTKKLASGKDATPQWRHNLAVSYFKVGDALFEADDREEALKEFLLGLPLAEEIAASDPTYLKWQAHLGVYYLELGRLYALSAENDAARSYLLRGQEIFDKLTKKAPLSRQYIGWMKRIEENLLDLQ